MTFYGDIEESPATEEIICEAYLRNKEPEHCIYFDELW